MIPQRTLAWTCFRLLASLCCVLPVATQTPSAQTPSSCQSAVLTLKAAAKLLRVDVREIERLAEQGRLPARRIGSDWRFSCAALMAWLAEARSPLVSPEAAQVAGTGLSSGSQNPTPVRPPGQDAQKPIGEAPEEREAEDVFLRGQRVLLRRGEVVVDFGQFYSHSSDHSLGFVAGGVALTTIEQMTLTTLLLGRVGIFDETELYASTTFHRQGVRQFIGNTTVATSDRSDFGGTQLGVRRTLLREKAHRPDIVVTFQGQILSGDTPYAAGAGVILVKSIDPVVLFANVGYLRNFADDLPAAARTLPKNRFDVALGYGIALNDTLALSMAVSGALSGATTLDEVRFRQPARFIGRVGLTSWLAKGLYIEPSVSFALTGPGQSFAFGVTLPYAF